jgi:hypothetical protein
MVDNNKGTIRASFAARNVAIIVNAVSRLSSESSLGYVDWILYDDPEGQIWEQPGHGPVLSHRPGWSKN